MDKEMFLKLLREGAKMPLHDWVIEEMARFLKNQGWVIREKHLGGEHGLDILAVSPSGKHFIFMRKTWLATLGWTKSLLLKIERNPDSSITVRKV